MFMHVTSAEIISRFVNGQKMNHQQFYVKTFIK